MEKMIQKNVIGYDVMRTSKPSNTTMWLSGKRIDTIHYRNMLTMSRNRIKLTCP